MLMLAINIAMEASTTDVMSSDEICVYAPIIIILLTAFVTDISGVCNEAVTFHTTI